MFTFSSTATDPARLLCPGPPVTHVSTLHKSSNPILNFLFSLFHALQLSFAHSQFWSQRMLTDQMNSVSLRTRLFISASVGITLFRELNNPVLSRSQRRDQLHGAQACAFVRRPRLRLSLGSCEGDRGAGVTNRTAGSPAKREAIYSSRLLLVG